MVPKSPLPELSVWDASERFSRKQVYICQLFCRSARDCLRRFEVPSAEA
ncbi:hypothetical protein RSSM_00726 [Rhodopirellula sallentina SM41]|uniref:Uncharacterized protein n=1 Tax=Rhodopirellula sallentina SM41 TaxID=1263870 RepID=M5UPC5_9BACT|nr:hypothetical protein RSSM_00726 [Rhodopirellula sallentina SM41]